MADEDVNGDSDEVQQEKSQKKIAKYDSGAADLERVTDYAEEKEISSSEGFSCVSSINYYGDYFFKQVIWSFNIWNVLNFTRDLFSGF